MITYYKNRLKNMKIMATIILSTKIYCSSANYWTKSQYSYYFWKAYYCVCDLWANFNASQVFWQCVFRVCLLLVAPQCTAIHLSQLTASLTTSTVPAPKPTVCQSVTHRSHRQNWGWHRAFWWPRIVGKKTN